MDGECGYIVYKRGFTNNTDWKTNEKWYKDYSSAINSAIKLVKEYSFMDGYYSVIVYKGAKELLKESHRIPETVGVVFRWNNR